jgi:hypothetical protein
VNQVNTRQVWENQDKKKFVDAAFLQPDETHFATLDQNGVVQIFYLKQKEEVNGQIYEYFKALGSCKIKYQ